MQSLTLQIQLDPKKERVCIRCLKVFRRKRYISDYNWEHAHKICSRECYGPWSDHRNGLHLRYRQHLYVCSTCGCEVIGNKKDLLKHKHERHAY